MSADLIEALRHAQHAGSVAFELRDPEDAIRPARRRVRRHKAVVGGATAVGAVAVVGAAAWGVGQLPYAGTTMADEPPMGGGPADAPDATAGGPDAEDVAVAERMTLDALLAQAVAREQGDPDDGRTAVLECKPEDDPVIGHDPSVPGRAYSLVECGTLWASPDAHLTMGDDTAVSLDVVEGTVTIRYTITNDGTLAIPYREAVYGVLETDSDLRTDDSGYMSGLTLSETSAWADATTRVAVLTSDVESAVLGPGESITGTLVWSGDAADGTALGRILGGGADFSFTLGVRVQDQDPTVIRPVIIEVSTGFEYGLEREPS